MQNHWTLHAGHLIATPRGSFTIHRCDSWGGTPSELDDAVRLASTAPELLDALRMAVTALNVTKRFRVGDTDSYAIAKQCDHIISIAEGRTPAE